MKNLLSLIACLAVSLCGAAEINPAIPEMGGAVSSSSSTKPYTLEVRYMEIESGTPWQKIPTAGFLVQAKKLDVAITAQDEGQLSSPDLFDLSYKIRKANGQFSLQISLTATTTSGGAHAIKTVLAIPESEWVMIGGGSRFGAAVRIRPRQ